MLNAYNLWLFKNNFDNSNKPKLQDFMYNVVYQLLENCGELTSCSINTKTSLSTTNTNTSLSTTNTKTSLSIINTKTASLLPTPKQPLYYQHQN
ncbi:hypothetical protein Pmani_017990 [Petrolisthes manimaculis]|uniref:Uncharacterized protein n=1 Tax=Petrolisthes manimaculis TaxID=1843537 RepID=A0AAE1U765_9EUCA|nr:hypothetical protein Pmani_017990 [Petrolisthes manimaculis]